ncbi:hydantoinase B/oxoprolinase family protein, partial [Rhizobium leguminosarum]
MRAELREFPNGVYSFEDYMEDDGIEKRRYKIAVDVFVQDDEIVVDFRRSDKQAKGPINGVLSVALSASYNAILHLTDPSIPKNSGCFRPIRVVAPPGLVVNANYPAPEVGGNTETHIRICYTVIGALAVAVPERAFATDGGTHSNFLFGGQNSRTDEYV